MTTRNHQRKELNSPSSLLVASPSANGTPYARSVVLLLRNDPRGAAGILVDDAFRASFRSLRRQIGERSALQENLTIQREMQLKVVNWSTDHLLAELQAGIWLTTPAVQADLEREDLWVDLVRRIGRSVLQDSLGISKFPQDPTTN